MSLRQVELSELHNETKFPTAMSFNSDAHWSDVATVFSGDSAAGEDLDADLLGSMNKAGIAPPVVVLFHSTVSSNPCQEITDGSETSNPEEELESEISFRQRDCDDSLEVETHSVGVHSYHSQDDAISVETS